jgi:chromosome segregation ATPase
MGKLVCESNRMEIPYKEMLIFFGTVITAILSTLAVVRKNDKDTQTEVRKNEKDAQNELRDDLMKLFQEQTQRIDKLNEELTALRYKNIDLLEALNAEKQLAADIKTENARLSSELKEVREDKARLANQVMRLEDEIRQLRYIIAELQKHSVGYAEHIKRQQD